MKKSPLCAFLSLDFLVQCSSNFGLARVFEFAALPDTECEKISSSVKSLRISKLTELNTEVEFEIISLHSFSN